MEHNVFFDKVENDIYKLLTFEENLNEHNRPKDYNQHELEYYKKCFIVKLEEELIVAKDIINNKKEDFENYHNLVSYLEKLLDEFYLIEDKNS